MDQIIHHQIQPPTINEKSIHEVIQEFVSNYTNQNTIRKYSFILLEYFDFINVIKIIELADLPFFELSHKSTQYLLSNGKPATIRQRNACLNSFYKWLVDFYGFSKNPIRKPRLPEQTKKSNTKSMEGEELKKKLKYLQDYAFYSYLDHLAYVLSYTLITTTLRISEVLQITTDMTEKGEITIVQKRGKVRKIDLPKALVAEITKFTTKYNITGKVFQTSGSRKTRQPITSQHAANLLKKKVGMSPHGFRKTAIEMLRDHGTPSEEIARITGHASVTMIDYYDAKERKPTAQYTLNSLIGG